MPETLAPAYTRVLLKLSGEALMGDRDYGIDPARVQAIAAETGENVVVRRFARFAVGG